MSIPSWYSQYDGDAFGEKEDYTNNRLLDAARVLLSVLELESRLGTIFLQIGQLFGVYSASSLPKSISGVY